MQTIDTLIHAEGTLLGQSIVYTTNYNRGSPNVLYMFQQLKLCPLQTYTLGYSWYDSPDNMGPTLLTSIGATKISLLGLLEDVRWTSS